MSGPAPLELTVLRSPDDLAACRDAWDACVAATGGDIYFTADWILTWWRHFGQRRRFLAIRVGDQRGLVAVLAFAVETFGPAPFGLRIARLAGMDHNFAILGLPLRSDRAVEAMGAVFARLTGEEHCNGISLSPISDVAEGLAATRAAAQDQGLSVVVDNTARGHTVLRLPTTFEAYWGGLSKSRQKEYRRSKTKMEQRYQLEYRASTLGSVEAMFANFVVLHAEQWRAAGKGGHFSDWAGSSRFYADIVKCLAPSGRAFIEEHLGNEQVLSSRLTFRFGQRAYWRLTARSKDSEVLRLGVGRVSLVERVGLLIASGVDLVEAGAGEYDYKLNYGGELIALRQIVLAAQGQHRRIRLLLVWADLLHLLYYRIWFLKLAPRLGRFGFRPRPLWQVWIRTRL